MNKRIFGAILILVLTAPLLIQCKHLDYLRTGAAGKNLLQVLTFGDKTVNLKELRKITLKGFSIGDFSHPLVRKHLRLYNQHGKRTLEAIMQRGAFYLPTIKRIFKTHGIPEELAYLPVIESGYRNKAISSAAAVGMWQFTYDTGIMYKLNANYWYDERSDFYKATVASAYHLKYLYRVFDDWLLTLAAYNAGVGKISRAIKRYKTRNFWHLIENSYIKGETANYVPKYIAVVTMIKNPQRYGISLPKEQMETPVRTFTVSDATEIELLIKCAEMPRELFTRYNTSLLRWTTPPLRTYKIYIPNQYYDTLVTNLAKIPPEERVTFREYFIKIGDTLSTIAARFNIPANPIAILNDLKSLNEIRAGEILILPIRGREKITTIDQNLTDSHNNTLIGLTRQLDTKRIAKKSQKRLQTQLLRKSTTYNQDTSESSIETYHFIHVLSPTDTLYAIARSYDVSLESLMRWNGLKNSRSLRAGRHLFIKITR
ncbi:membrane-bound lytic murein transglycosylase D [Spirochaetota bacterium]|nr:membrane-bound lytic murein transglycosylase D [Spirochaetota bacterium]